MTQLTPFDKTDWMGFSGAEKFADGGEPLVSYQVKVDGLDAMAILDANGFFFQVYSPDGEEVAFINYHAGDANAIAVMRFLATLKPEYTTGELIDMGLKPERSN